jgi:polysaccharide pyruvyl transferase WcaK-like protein
MKKVLFLGTHGQKNWGDELLLRVFIHQLNDVTEKFYINSYDPQQTAAYLEQPNATVFNTKTDRLKLMSYLLRCDALVFGGGNILKELYTAYGGSQYATLQVIDTLTKAAVMLNKPIYLSNIGVGPLFSDRGRHMTKRIVERANLTTVRDRGSYDTLTALHVTSPLALTSDAVFAADRPYFGLPADRPKRRIDSVADIQTMGINLCRNISNDKNWEYFLRHLAGDILHMYKQHPNMHFVGVPMQFAVASNNDSSALEELATMLHGTEPNLRFKIVEPHSVKELATIIDSFDIFVAERLHALILAIIIGVPIMALEYDIKVTGIMKDLELNKYGVDINTSFDEGRVAAILQDITGNYTDAMSSIKKAYGTNHRAALGSFDTLRQLLNGKN